MTEALFKRPGWWRALAYTIIAGAFGFALVVALRKISGLPAFQTEQTGYPQIIVPAITAPFGFLIGIGCFDYWFRWAIGAPTFPKEREHENHGAYSWRDYFKVNTDHKVIGVQYLVTTFIFFIIAAVGALVDAKAEKTIDAAGMVVAPGFIDMLGQSDLSILVNPRLPSKIFQGITTEITGEGSSAAPLNDTVTLFSPAFALAMFAAE